jgi:hypothetical protein
MNIEHWIERFRKNSDEEVLDWSTAVTLEPSIRESLAASLAIFQLGESGEGSTLFRYAEKVGATPGYERYPEALRLFLKIVKWGVWFDHRCCFKDLGVGKVQFFDRITKAERTFTRRILNETLPSNWCSIP